jgi:hypothetical protein
VLNASAIRTASRHDRADRKTQCALILSLLIEARGEWVSLRDILALGVAQYNSRIHDARRLGFVIENRIERDDAGVVRSWYRLINSVQQPAKVEDPKPITDSDWYTATTGKPRPSLDRENLFLFDIAGARR